MYAMFFALLFALLSSLAQAAEHNSTLVHTASNYTMPAAKAMETPEGGVEDITPAKNTQVIMGGIIVGLIVIAGLISICFATYQRRRDAKRGICHAEGQPAEQA
ncbi:unnamed protein product [Periconia digitata]|uniref:Uncharacterized protein n=1 Tax=Periconia digitata TaxID=1303443 RepID=A0A9W4U2L7_9PLEO|nr:unnamed protein product [Periconia digitata]